MYTVILDPGSLTGVDVTADSVSEDKGILKLYQGGKCVAIFHNYVGVIPAGGKK